MSRLTVLADLTGRHTAHDVYDLWVQSRGESVLVGWETAAGGQTNFCLDTQGEVSRPMVGGRFRGALSASRACAGRGWRCSELRRSLLAG